MYGSPIRTHNFDSSVSQKDVIGHLKQIRDKANLTSDKVLANILLDKFATSNEQRNNTLLGLICSAQMMNIDRTELNYASSSSETRIGPYHLNQQNQLINLRKYLIVFIDY